MTPGRAMLMAAVPSTVLLTAAWGGCAPEPTQTMFGHLQERQSFAAMQTAHMLQASPVSRPTFATRAPGFDISGGCLRLGGSVICDLTIINEDATQTVKLNGATIYDHNSRSYRDSGLTLAGRGPYHNPSAKLIHGLPAKATFRFNNVPEQVTEIYRLEFGIQPEHAGPYQVVINTLYLSHSEL